MYYRKNSHQVNLTSPVTYSLIVSNSDMKMIVKLKNKNSGKIYIPEENDVLMLKNTRLYNRQFYYNTS